MDGLLKPLPRPTPTAQPFWDSLADGVIRVQRCGRCQRWIFYPRARCTGCLSNELIWREVPGGGHVHSFTIARVPTLPEFADEVPQLIAIVELDEGIRLTTTLVDVRPEAVTVGMRVSPKITVEPHDTRLLRFAPARTDTEAPEPNTARRDDEP